MNRYKKLVPASQDERLCKPGTVGSLGMVYADVRKMRATSSPQASQEQNGACKQVFEAVVLRKPARRLTITHIFWDALSGKT